MLTVADLKKEMKKVGLKPRGLKRNLVKQLAEKHYQIAVLWIICISYEIVWWMETKEAKCNQAIKNSFY